MSARYKRSSRRPPEYIRPNKPPSLLSHVVGDVEGNNSKPPLAKFKEEHLDEESSEAMADDKGNHEIRISIPELKKELKELESNSPAYDSMLQIPPENSIFNVLRKLRQVNAEAYEPQIISIGPYHHGKQHLKKMELQKKYCLNAVLCRSNASLDECFAAMIEKEGKARRYYGDTVNMSPAEFAEMMLLDGCFIVELIRLVPKNSDKQHDPSDHLFKVKMDLPELAYDLLLLENQLPLFVLQYLFDMSRMPDEEETFIHKAISFFCESPNYQNGDSNGAKHLLELVYQQCIPKSYGNTTVKADENKHKLRTMPNATALEEYGVKFKPKEVDKKTTLFDIKFEKETGKMEIPGLRIEDNTERILRNFMAYEQFITAPAFVCDYAMFMDCLINSDKDVELLYRQGVIDNWLGDHEVVAKMFNSLCQHVKITTESYYHNTCVDVIDHCEEPWNRWMATLKRDYFNTPWALISFLAALLLLLITVAQFIISFF